MQPRRGSSASPLASTNQLTCLTVTLWSHISLWVQGNIYLQASYLVAQPQSSGLLTARPQYLLTTPEYYQVLLRYRMVVQNTKTVQIGRIIGEPKLDGAQLPTSPACGSIHQWFESRNPKQWDHGVCVTLVFYQDESCLTNLNSVYSICLRNANYERPQEPVAAEAQVGLQGAQLQYVQAHSWRGMKVFRRQGICKIMLAG